MNLIRKVEILGNLLNEKQENRCYFHFKLNLKCFSLCSPLDVQAHDMNSVPVAHDVGAINSMNTSGNLINFEFQLKYFGAAIFYNQLFRCAQSYWSTGSIIFGQFESFQWKLMTEIVCRCCFIDLTPCIPLFTLRTPFCNFYTLISQLCMMNDSARWRPFRRNHVRHDLFTH